jgi:hypothetical protein
MTYTIHKPSYFFVLFAGFALCCVQQVCAFSSTAHEIAVADASLVQSGDMVSFDSEQGEYVRAHEGNERGLFGVVVSDPAVLIRGNAMTADTRVMTPVVRDGEVRVNVSDGAGDIYRGDMIAPSVVIGFGEKQRSDERGYVIGVAIEDVVWAGVDASGRRYGTVLVALQIGSYLPEIGIGEGMSVAEMMQRSTEESTGKNGTEGGFDENRNNAIFDILQLFRYTIGSLLAVISIVIAVKKLGELFSQGIISVGRNPLAKSQIHKILFWNSVLILLLSAVGFFIGIAIIFFS